MLIRKISIILVSAFLNISLFAREADSLKEPWVKLNGYVRSDVFFDTRENLTAINGLFLFYPLNEKLSNEGKDLNAHSSLTLLAVSSRLNATFRTPDVLKAKVTGRIEVDFTIFSESTSLRLRHAYGRFSWKHTDLLLGQTWHPAFVEDCVPAVLGLSTGAPFQEFNRAPQIRITQKFNKFQLLGAFISQMDYMSPGPQGTSPHYLRNAIVPEFDLQLKYNGDHFSAGLNGSLKTIKPRTETMGIDSTIYKAFQTLTTYSVKGFARYFTGNMELKASVTYGQNLFDYLMQGGYGVSSLDPRTGKEEYTPLAGIYSWINLVYGKKWQGSLTAGYGYNLGSIKPLIDKDLVWARGADIKQLYRIVPSLFYNIGKLQFGLEYELNTAYYGSLNLHNGRVYDSKPITNHRVAFAATFFF